MKKILVPTDFSPNAETAFAYALRLADELNAKVTVVHIYHPSALHVDDMLFTSEEELLRFNSEKLNQFVEKGVTKNRGEVATAEQVDQTLISGFAVDELVKLSKTGQYDVMVMGTTGASGLFEKVFGKVSTQVAKLSECPVLLIPMGLLYRDVRSIMYAGNYESVNEKVLLRIGKLSKALKAKVHLVHVLDKDNEEDGKLFDEDFFENIGKVEHLSRLFQKNAPDLKFKMHHIQNDKVADGLQEFAQENDMDWMVLVKPHRNIWQRLTRRSETDELVMNPQIPIMVIH